MVDSDTWRSRYGITLVRDATSTAECRASSAISPSVTASASASGTTSAAVS